VYVPAVIKTAVEQAVKRQFLAVTTELPVKRKPVDAIANVQL
jgi:hypothetical protein